jgi:hypothetical protein
MRNKFLFAAQGVGALLFATVCVAYIFGLQATKLNIVLHEQQSFRIVLGASGIIFLIMVTAGIIWALKSKPRTS